MFAVAGGCRCWLWLSLQLLWLRLLVAVAVVIVVLAERLLLQRTVVSAHLTLEPTRAAGERYQNAKTSQKHTRTQR
jgi:hypothetical protein